MSRAPALSVVRPDDPAQLAMVAARTGRADAILAAEDALRMAGATMARLRLVGTLELAPAGVRDLCVRLAEEIDVRLMTGRALIDRATGTRS